jgi:hypothetical protein
MEILMEINRFLAYGPLIVLIFSILATAGFSFRAVTELKKGSEATQTTWLSIAAISLNVVYFAAFIVFSQCIVGAIYTWYF